MNPLLLFMLCLLLVLICMANHLCMYIRTLCVGVCLLGTRAQSHYWLNGEHGAGAVFPLSSYQIQQLLTAYVITPYLPSSMWMPKRHEGLPGTSLHLATSILQGLPLHPLCIKAVNQKRSISEENKSENYILLNVHYVFFSLIY